MKFKVGDIVECIDIGHHTHIVGEIYKITSINGDLNAVTCVKTGKREGAAFSKRFRLSKEYKVINLLNQVDSLESPKTNRNAQEKLIRSTNKVTKGGSKRSPRAVQKRPIKATRTVRNRHGAS